MKEQVLNALLPGPAKCCNEVPYTVELMPQHPRQVLKIPIAHNEGNYFVEPEKLEELEANNQVVVRYCDPEGNVADKDNPNGSLNNIAGISNKNGNVFGLMPHPERASELRLGSDDGKYIFQSLIESYS